MYTLKCRNAYLVHMRINQNEVHNCIVNKYITVKFISYLTKLILSQISWWIVLSIKPDAVVEVLIQMQSYLIELDLIENIECSSHKVLINIVKYSNNKQ